VGETSLGRKADTYQTADRGEEMEIDHIGIAVHSLDDGAKLYGDGIGLPRLGVERVEDQGVDVLKLDTGNTHIELLQPCEPGVGPIGKFLEKRGPGIHHICFRVPDIRAAAANLRALGYRTLSDEPTPGADDCLVMFLHPKDAGGTLIELSQPAAAGA
jgi:methylmalonyl-CoA epimerase